jgi:hypothetical protein
VKFVGGKYKGKWGWLDPTKEPTAMKTYVFVSKDATSSVGVMTENIVNVEQFDPKTISGAVMKKRPEAWALMNQACKLLAICHIDVEHVTEFAELFGVTLEARLEDLDDDSTFYSMPEVKTDSRKRR